MSIEQKTIETHAIVKAKREAVENAKNPTYITNGVLTIDPESGVKVDVRKANEYSITQQVIPFLLRTKSTNDYLKEQGLQVPKIGSRTVEEWLKDAVTRLNSLQTVSLEAELKKREAMLQSLLSANPKVATEIAVEELEGDEFLKSGLDTESNDNPTE